jgi:Caenorhabditis protein of unknown function, DUF268
MQVGHAVRKLVKSTVHEMGLAAWLHGDVRPPRGGFDLRGEKIIDWGWICVNLPKGPTRALEIGSGESPIIPAMLALGYDVTAVDLSEDISSVLSGMKFHYADFMKMELETGFDVIVLCSVVEHIGLAGRYNSREDPEGDLKAMRKVLQLLSPRGQLFLTIPVGKDSVHRPWHRVYGRERLKQLLDGFEVIQSRFLLKHSWGPWHLAEEEVALSFGPDVQRYALGEFILRKQASK